MTNYDQTRTELMKKCNSTSLTAIGYEDLEMDPKVVLRNLEGSKREHNFFSHNVRTKNLSPVLLPCLHITIS